MEDLEELKSVCSVESNELPPMPPLMKSRRNMLNQSSRDHGPSSVPPSSESNIGDPNTERAWCMSSASPENREDTSNIPPDYTSSIVSVSPPPLIKWTRNTITSASVSNRNPALEQTILTAGKSESNEVRSSTLAEIEDVVNWTSKFSAYEKRASPVKPPLQIEMDVVTPAKASYTGVSAGRTPETWKQPDAFGIPVEHSRPIGQNAYSSKVMAQNQDQDKRSKCKTSRRCQFCQKQFKQVSHLREHKRIHTGDRPFECDVCGMSFTQSSTLCVHKRTHTGNRPFKCKTCGTSFTHSLDLRRHERIHSGERPFTCKTCGKSFN
ncbi:zinc finger protein 678-like [Sycon ciliatum]|uniref:zinc finger protein 678-like n=1 Tax=Sycon ciliatum TaxID=27933 RepID=UPI0031F60E10